VVLAQTQVNLRALKHAHSDSWTASKWFIWIISKKFIFIKRIRIHWKCIRTWWHSGTVQKAIQSPQNATLARWLVDHNCDSLVGQQRMRACEVLSPVAGHFNCNSDCQQCIPHFLHLEKTFNTKQMLPQYSLK